MIGAIIGDIVGSVYEWNNIKTKEFPLFCEDCFFTDDTVMTIATADAILNGGKVDNFIDSYKKWGRLYPNYDYGVRFNKWIHSDDREPYNSWGNGSAMRVSPCGWAAKSLDEAETLAAQSAAVTHNHPEGIRGAQATAAAIYLARTNSNKSRIKRYIENKYGYDLGKSLDEIRPTYIFNESCQDTVPQAIIAFLESKSFEDAIRNAISLGGDSDTLAAITGSIAEAAYRVRSDTITKAFFFLDNKLSTVINLWMDSGKPVGTPATKMDWKTNEFSIAHTIHGEIRFTETQFARVRQGLLPEQMEDKWFAYCEGNTLCFHRSWTGSKIFEAEIHKYGENYRITDIKVERDGEIYSCTNDMHDYRTFKFLMAVALLGLKDDIPVSKSGEGGMLEAWSSFGNLIM